MSAELGRDIADFTRKTARAGFLAASLAFGATAVAEATSPPPHAGFTIDVKKLAAETPQQIHQELQHDNQVIKMAVQYHTPLDITIVSGNHSRTVTVKL